MLKFLQKILPNFHSPPPKFSFSLPFQKKLATSFKQQYNPSKLESTQYKLPPSFQSDVENRFVRTWSKLISFPLDEQSFKLKEYKHKKKNQLLLNPEEKLTNTPRESYYEALLYFSTNKDLQNSLRSFNAETIRIDLMFDLLDCLAGLSSFSHCYCLDENHGLRNVVIVTAAVDHINFFKPWLIDKDMRIIAYPSWCGQSVIEIRIDLFQKNVNNEEELVGNAIFLMAARNLKNNKEKFEVPKLSFEGELEKDICIKRYAEGAKNQEIRKINGKNVLDVPPPTVEEIKNMHEVFKLCEKSKNGKDFLYQEETKIYKTLMMYPQNQNLYGTIFGGFTIKEGFEIGVLAAYMSSNGAPFQIRKIDDFNFLSPIFKGCALKFEASVVFASHGIMQIVVIAWIMTAKKEKFKASVVHLTFEFENQELMPVYPHTYAEALLYFEGKRKLKKILKEGISI